MVTLLISALILLLVVCIIASLVCWILSNIPGVPPWSSKVVWAVAGIIILIWIVGHLGAVGIR